MLPEDNPHYLARLDALRDRQEDLGALRDGRPAPTFLFRRDVVGEAPERQTGLLAKALGQALNRAGLADEAHELFTHSIRWVDDVRRLVLMLEYDCLVLEERLQYGNQIVGILSMRAEDLQ